MTWDAPHASDQPGAFHALLIEAQVAAIKALGGLAERDDQRIRERARKDLLGLARDWDS